MKIEVNVFRRIGTNLWNVSVCIPDYASVEWVERDVAIHNEVKFLESQAYREMLAEAMSKAINDIEAEEMEPNESANVG